MMKSIYKKAVLALITLTPLIASAHTGHLPNESAHGFLHAEHLIIIISIGLIAFTIDYVRRK